MKVLAVVLHKYELPKLVAADSNNLAQPEQLLEHPVVNIPTGLTVSLRAIFGHLHQRQAEQQSR
jgi:hypothetical protein